ncbi:cold-shock protein [Taibaiella soli]|uniref:Cold shock domain-containing protein n=1 Tax=Taibaiella soli TaxID=1649169 RepID=A0A2W2BDV9_9BACT|nr:cold shock domain-containing protein [Taibaiella soli]PZF71776.1 cold shock domain-containing protein [Taibaiella soli]
MAGTFAKKELEQKKAKARKEKAERKEQRKLNNNKGKSLDDMMVYLDENGNFTSTPPDPRRKVEINLEDIVLGAAPQGKEFDIERIGFVTFFDETKGYGFISDNLSKDNVFVHSSAASQPLKKGNKVSYERERGPKGFVAVNVKVLR